MPNTARKPSVIAAVAATARPTAHRRAAAARRVSPHHEREVGGQHRETARVQRGHQSGGERQPDQVLLHSRYAASAETRSCSSCCGMADVGLFTNVDVPSAR